MREHAADREGVLDDVGVASLVIDVDRQPQSDVPSRAVDGLVVPELAGERADLRPNRLFFLHDLEADDRVVEAEGSPLRRGLRQGQVHEAVRAVDDLDASEGPDALPPAVGRFDPQLAHILIDPKIYISAHVFKIFFIFVQI